MGECDRCGASVALGGEWVEVNHHHANMTFGSTFCSADCAAAYLENGLEDGLEADSDGVDA